MRIVGGRFGGRRLVAPKTSATRPTPDRVREALFSVLGDLAGVAVLDLYAGSGALGLEALSRGAVRAVFVDSQRAALDAIRENVAALGVGGDVVVVSRPVERAAAAIAQHGPFELVLADPPYADVASGVATKALESVVREPGVLAEGALVVVEHAARDAPPVPSGLDLEETRRYGDTALTLLRRP